MQKRIAVILPFLTAGVCSLLSFSSADRKIADLFQRPLPPLAEDPHVSMINVDDDSIENIGTWPFSRDVYADMLLTLRENGAQSVIFDLSFLDKSQAKADENYVGTELPEMVSGEMDSLANDLAAIFAEAAVGGVTEEAMEQLEARSDEAKAIISEHISRSTKDVDSVLANAIEASGNVFLTLTLGDEFPQPSDSMREILSNCAEIKRFSMDGDSRTPEAKSVMPAIEQFIGRAAGAGFVNADPDSDGYLRHIHIVRKTGGKLYGQLTFTPLWRRLGEPKITVTDSAVTLAGAKLPDGTVRDITIPRSEDGSLIVKYPPKNYMEYNSIPLWNIYMIRVLERQIGGNLTELSNGGLFNALPASPADYWNIEEEAYRNLLEAPADERTETFESWQEKKKQFLAVAAESVSEEAEAMLVAEYGEDEETAAWIRDVLGAVRAQLAQLAEENAKLRAKAEGTMFIVGTNATSTTDYGLNQYEEHYPNPGVHYTVLNQLISGDFVDDSPVWVSIALSIALSLAASFVLGRIKDTGKMIAIGVVSVVATLGALLGFFLVTRTFVGVIAPVSSVALTFATISTLEFLAAANDKKFITNAFSQCLSKDVVDQLIADPSSFKLGGEKREMTAMFTDIQKFSSFSELLSASQLVALLNYYLTRMSDIIMEERGTVDKYEGDAIVALVGAPLKMEGGEHAVNACAAALKMKKAELGMNEEILRVAAAPKPEDMPDDLYDAFRIMVENKKVLFTRIGLNSGEMTAGYMGSENKKNYTMMGNNVNLASRLEGVNKQYSTGGILISEHTEKLLGDRFVVRPLDRVQVVNVKTPLRLYELVAERSGADDSLVKYMDEWRTALGKFEKRDYAAALADFKSLASRRKDDNVVRYYIKLTEDFFIKGKYPTADDDVGVAFNPENGVFTLMQK